MDEKPNQSDRMDSNELQISRTPLVTGIGLNLPTANESELSKPTSKKSDTSINNTGKNLPISKDSFDRRKKTNQGTLTSKLLQGKITPKQLYSYLEDAKTSLQLDTKLGSLTPQQMKKYNFQPMGKIESVRRGEKIDPAVSLLLKSTEPKTLPRSSTPSELQSLLKMSDTALSFKTADIQKASFDIKKDKGESSSIAKMTIGNVPLAGRLITDKGTFTTCELSVRTPPSSTDQLHSKELLSAADEMLSKVEGFEEKMKISSSKQKKTKIVGIPQTNILHINYPTTGLNTISSKTAPQITKDDSQKGIPQVITKDQDTQTPKTGIPTDRCTNQRIKDGSKRRTDTIHKDSQRLKPDIPVGKLPHQSTSAEFPRQIQTGEFPYRTPASEIPHQIPTGEVPSQILATEVPSQIPAGGIPSQIPTGKVPSQIPAGEVPSQIPADGLLSQIPVGEVPSQIPVGEVPSQIPAGEVPNQIPAGEIQSQIPAGGLPSQIPVGEVPSQIPIGEIQSQIPAGGLPSQIPVGEVPSQIPIGEIQSQIPAGGLPSQIPVGEVPTEIPTSEVPSQIPAGEVPSQILTGEIQSQIPAGEVPSQIPVGEVPSQILASKIPSQIPVGEVPSQIPVGEVSSQIPVGEVSSQIPVGEVSSQIPVGEVSSQIPVGEVPSQIPAGEVQSRIPVSEVPSQIPVGGVPSQIPASEVPSQIPAGGLPSQIPAGEVTRQIPAGELSHQVPVYEPVHPITDVDPAHGIPAGEPAHRIPAGEPAHRIPVGEPAHGIPDVEPEHPIPAGEVPSQAPGGVLEYDIPASQITDYVGTEMSISLCNETQTPWTYIPDVELADEKSVGELPDQTLAVEHLDQPPVGKLAHQPPAGKLAHKITKDGSKQKSDSMYKDKQISRPDIPAGQPARQMPPSQPARQITKDGSFRSSGSRLNIQNLSSRKISRRFTMNGPNQRKNSDRGGYPIPEKLSKTMTAIKVTDLTDEMEQFKHFLKSPSLPPEELAKNLMLQRKPTLEKSAFSKRKQHSSTEHQLERNESNMKKQKTQSKYQELQVTGKDLSTLNDFDPVIQKADDHSFRKPDDAIENVVLDEEKVSSDTLDMIWDNYEQHNQISEEIPTQDLESFIEEAKEIFQDYFRERHDTTGDLMKSVSFSLKEQDKISKEQAMLLMKQALVDPQLAELLKTGKKEDFLARLKLTQLVSSLKEDDTAHPDEEADVVPGEGENLNETADEKSGLVKDVDASEEKRTKVNVEAMEEENITVTDEIAAVPKDVTTGGPDALMEAVEVEELGKPDSTIPGKLSEDVIPTNKSEDISSVNEPLKKEVDMPEEASATGPAIDLDSAVLKDDLSVPYTDSPFDSTSGAAIMVHQDNSDTGTKDLAEGGTTEGSPTVTTEGSPTVSKEGSPTVITDSPPTVHMEGLSTVPTENSLTIPSTVPPILPTGGLPTKDKPVKYITSSEEKISAAPKPERKKSNLGRDKPKLSVPPLKKTLSKKEIAVVDELLTKHNPSAEKDHSLGSASTTSSAYNTMATDNSIVKGKLTDSVSNHSGDGLTTKDVSSRKYGQDESSKNPVPREKPKEKLKGKRLSQTNQGKIKKRKSDTEEEKTLPDIGASRKIEKSESKILKKKVSASKTDINKEAAKEEKKHLLMRKSQRRLTDDAKLKSMFKDQDAKEDFIQMGLEKILLMAKDSKRGKKEYDLNKKQFKDPIEVRDTLHKRREQVNQLIMGMSDEKGMELENMMQSQHELFDELETYEDEEINETLSLLTKVLHLDLEDKSPEENEVVEPEIQKKENNILQVKEAELIAVAREKEEKEEEEEEEGEEEEEEMSRVQTLEEKEEMRFEEPRKFQSKPEVEIALPAPSQEALDESLFRNALLKMKTLNIFNAIKALGITHPQMKDFDDYIAQNRLTEFMDPEEIEHLRRAASELFVSKGKSKNKGRKKSLRSSSTIKAKDLKNARSLSENQMTSKIELEVSEAVEDIGRLQKQAALTNMKQELEMLSLEQEITEPYIFSYYVHWPEPPKTQNKPGRKK